MQKAIGPTFEKELAAYGGLLGAHFSWRPDGTIEFFPDTPPDVEAGVEAVYAAHDPTKVDAVALGLAARAAGVAVTSDGTPALNATYGCTFFDQLVLTTLQTAIAANQSIGGSYSDSRGNYVLVTPAQLINIAGAVFAYAAAVDAWQAGGATGTPPTATATIP